ncbi:glycerophosphodiester phosphodiesterase [Halorutilales archaeon Cl-col2-1]
MTRLIGHRGCGLAPENTVEAVEKAADYVDVVEVDVRATKDGVPVLLHDETVDRTTSKTGRLDSYRYEEIEDFVPRLDEALEAAEEYGLDLNIEVKERRVTDAVLDLLEGYPGDVLVSSFDYAALRELAEKSNHGLAPLFEEGDGFGVAEEVDASAVHPHHDLVDAEYVDEAIQRGLEVNAWTVNDVGRALELVSMGAGVITDVPHEIDPEMRDRAEDNESY